MKPTEAKKLIEDTLESRNLDKRATLLLHFTMGVESLFKHRQQIGGGPALGLLQMEPATHGDLFNSYLNYTSEPLDDRGAYTLKTDDRYAILCAYFQYSRYINRWPEDIKGAAHVWKYYWNTFLGAGNIKDAIDKYNNLLAEESLDEELVNIEGVTASDYEPELINYDPRRRVERINYEEDRTDIPQDAEEEQEKTQRRGFWERARQWAKDKDIAGKVIDVLPIGAGLKKILKGLI